VIPNAVSAAVSSIDSFFDALQDEDVPQPWTTPGPVAQRPPRLLLTLLGDYWWQRTESLPSAAIVGLLAEFGVSDSAARAALSRLTRNGLLVTLRNGRRTYVQLSSRAADVLDDGARRIFSFGGRPSPWDGMWSLVAFSIPEEHRSARDELRKALRWLGFAPLYDGLWVSPRAYPDFAWGWVTHFLVNLGNDLGTLYLLYFLSRGAHYHDPQTGLLILMALYAVALLAAGSVLGTLSDRSGKRKPFIIASAVVMALAATLLAVSPTWHFALVAAPLLGAGFGTYWSAAPALLTQVLPAAVDRGKDVGLINMAYNAPLVVAPLAAGVVLGLMNSYSALFALAGVVTIVAAWTVSRVRSVP